jgi:hypothetical protein
MYLKAFWHNVDSNLFKSWSSVGREGPQKGKAIQKKCCVSANPTDPKF